MTEKDFGSKHKSIKDVLKRVLLYCSGIRCITREEFDWKNRLMFILDTSGILYDI